MNVVTETFQLSTEITQRQRPKTVTADISLRTVGTKNPPVPLACKPFGGSGKDISGMDRGHIIAESLGGTNNSDNIVPMYPSFNQGSGTWRKLEQRITNITELYGNGHVSAKVDIVYADVDDEGKMIPQGFFVTVTCDGDHLYFQWNKLDRYWIAHVPVEAVQINVSMTQGTLVGIIQTAYTEMTSLKWKAEYDLPKEWAKRVPDLKYPRPYAVLDYLILRKQNETIWNYLGKRFLFKPLFGFTQEQKELIYLVNRMNNNGWLRSDYSGDSTANLPQASGRAGVQVDHVVPEASGGANLFSNAYVSSGLFNIKAGRKNTDEKMLLKL